MHRSLFFILSAVFLLFEGSVITRAQLTPADKETISDFQKRAKRYVERRQELSSELPKLPAKATPEQIETFQRSLQAAVQKDRANMREGDVFTQQVSLLMRDLIKKEFVGFERSELRKQVLEADTKGVPLKANVIYPEEKELVPMPPPLLLTLPELPKELRYRFVGRAMILMDRDSGLIIDIMRNALP